eukprot:4127077-Amphidinium_carterae.1
MTIVKCAIDAKRIVCWEWPKFCEHWKADASGQPGIAGRLSKLGLQVCEFDGCAFGMCVEGKYIRKPWRVMTNSMSLSRRLRGKHCTGKHEHQQCRGLIAKHSANYSKEMVDCVQHAFLEEVG